ncbi:MAG: FAD:protein FMN transferase [Lentilactobacillus hilgardii]|uniref:FAD:protein FMN transferase n=1 Tax=Lentilactobacillus hilgardii TaxID=1588 RepID=UPI001CC1E7DF|nr:FAD:protein FMN transferase [Lentilactobacillus hilgardii]MBZ2199882.1 hypothetical protein [Lentilactobacillus hilgardii]MBZ2203002.1 hypothetical protein [Lentilactobacillus hilgardii]
MQTINDTIQTSLFRHLRVSVVISEMVNHKVNQFKNKFTAITGQIKEKFDQVDQVFSLQNSGSLVAKFQRGDKQPLLKSADFQTVYSLANISKNKTNGYFDPFDGGRYTPSDLIKSWAVDQVFNQYLRPLVELPVAGIMLEADGVIQTAVATSSAFHWPVLVHDSFKGEGLLEKYQLTGGGIVTVNAKTSKRPQSPIKQLTIISERVSEATIWAIAGLNAGTAKFLRLINQKHLSGILIDRALGVIEFESGKLAQKQVF